MDIRGVTDARPLSYCKHNANDCWAYQQQLCGLALNMSITFKRLNRVVYVSLVPQLIHFNE